MTDKTKTASPFDGIDFALESEIMPAMLAQETRREATVKTLKIALGGIAAATLVLILIFAGLSNSQNGSSSFSQFILLGGAAAGFAVWTCYTRPLKARAKAVMVGGLTGYLQWRYTEKDFTPLSIAGFRRLGLLPDRHESEKFEDQISGAVAGKNFVMQELRLRTQGKNKVTTFHGQIFEMDCARKFTGQTLVLRDKARHGRSKRGAIPGLKRAGLADPHFESLFEVYTTDQVEARYLLPPDFMVRILDLESSVDGKNIRFAFSGGKLFIAVETGNRFEPNGPFQTYTDREPARKIISELRAIYELLRGLE